MKTSLHTALGTNFMGRRFACEEKVGGGQLGQPDGLVDPHGTHPYMEADPIGRKPEERRRKGQATVGLPPEEEPL